MARGVAGLVKSATGMIAQVPGAEDLVMQAVRDVFSEMKQLRRENAKLLKENQALRDRLERAREGGPAAARRSTANSVRRTVTAAKSPRPTASKAPAKAGSRKPAAKVPAKRRAPSKRRGGGILSDIFG